MKVYKLTVLIMDHDRVGADEIVNILENSHYPNHCISPNIVAIESRDIDWSDDHPLNRANTFEQTYKELFK